MAKLLAPLFSFTAKGPLAGDLSFARRAASNIAQLTPHPTDPQSSEQLTWRTMYQHCSAIWHTLTPAEKAHWTAAAQGKSMPPFALFLSNCLKPNPGIYLPLIGGTMKGDIDMDTSRILDLPGPTLDQEAATKKYVDDNAGGGGGQGHITILPLSYDSIAQGTWAIELELVYYLYSVLYNSSNANLDNLSYKIYLDAGTYTLLVLCGTGPNRAILDVDIDATEVASFDGYSVGFVPNVRNIQAGIVIAASGPKTLKLRVDGRHAASSAWYVIPGYMALWRTA